MATLGEKIKYFRKRKGISQFDLETLTNISPGSLSRIESGDVNPTKETMMRLNEVLSLNQKEYRYLFDNEYMKPSDSDINKIIESVKVYMDKASRVCYLLDRERRIRYFGEKVRKKATQYSINLEDLYGYSVLDIIFDPALPIRNIIPENKFDFIALTSIRSFKSDYSFLIELGEFNNYLDRLYNLPDFKRLWDSVPDDKISLYNYDSRIIELNIIGQKAKFNYAVIPVDEDDRFEIIEFTPINLFAKILFKTIR